MFDCVINKFESFEIVTGKTKSSVVVPYSILLTGIRIDNKIININ